MQIGCSAPTSGPLIEPDSLLRIATEAEALGFDYVTVSDHVMIPNSIASRYPYSDSGEFPSGAAAPRLEQLTAATFIAAVTSKLRIVTSVMVVPHRPAILAAKMLTTIDVLSGGRLDIGIGAGWQKVEIDAVATTPFAERGAVTDEYLDAFKAVWTQSHVRYQGKYTRIDGLLVDPKPVQKPHPPIWVGGETGPSMRRAARIGNVWYPIGSNNANMLDTLPRLTAGIAKIRTLTAAAGRDPAEMGVAYRVKRHGQEAPLATDGHRKLFTGSIGNVIEDIGALKAIGVTALDFDFEGRDTEVAIADMKKFQKEVLARI